MAFFKTPDRSEPAAKASAKDASVRSSASHSPHSAQSARHTVFSSKPSPRFVRCAERYADSARFALRSVAAKVKPEFAARGEPTFGSFFGFIMSQRGLVSGCIAIGCTWIDRRDGREAWCR